MPYNPKKTSGKNDNMDSIMDGLKDLGKSSATGTAPAENNESSSELLRIKRIIMILTRFSFLLGFLVFLYLWLR